MGCFAWTGPLACPSPFSVIPWIRSEKGFDTEVWYSTTSYVQKLKFQIKLCDNYWVSKSRLQLLFNHNFLHHNHMSRVGFEPWTLASVFSSWIWDISVLDHSANTAGFTHIDCLIGSFMLCAVLEFVQSIKVHPFYSVLKLPYAR